MSDLESLRTDGCLHIKPDSKLSFNIDSLLSDLKDAYVAESPAPKNPLGFLVSVLQRIQNNLDENARRPIDSPLLLSQPHPQELVSPVNADRFHSVPQMIESAHIDLTKQLKQYAGIDIGGSLCKVTFYEPNDPDICAHQRSETKYGTTGIRDPGLSFKYQSGTFHFISFETRRMDGAVDLLRENDLTSFHKKRRTFSNTDAFINTDLPSVMVTGGGAYKFSKMFLEKLSIRVNKKDELDCLLAGLNFLLHAVPDECYYISNPSKPEEITWDLSDLGQPIYPYLLVNVGSGVSILRVDSRDSFERVSGTCIGGGTYLGLCKLLTKYKSFSEVMEICSKGDAEKVDMLVRDIYGGNYDKFGLTASTVASSFGKMVMKENPWDGVTDADVSLSLLHMISRNISQLAYQNAVQHKVSRILFAGNFLKQNKISMGSISFAIDYWSRGEMKALFLKHEGYCGSVGAFLLQEEVDSDNEYETDENN